MAQALILDSEALNALANPGERGVLAVRTRAILQLARDESAIVRVPAPVLASAEWPDDLNVETVDVDRLPKNWSDAVAPLALRDVVRRWLERLETAVLQVPSAVVVEEWNFLLNPAHPDFRRLRLSRPRPYSFDRRPARRRKR